MSLFDLQGHRGARGLKPENTLCGFEIAFDLGVSSIETDVHLTGDGIPILSHDPVISERLCRLLPGRMAPDPSSRPAVSSLSLAQLRSYRADQNPDKQRFPNQDARVAPLARSYADAQGMDPYALPALADLFAFAEAYTGEPGERAGKTEAQRARVRQIRFDLELKRVPFRPAAIGDDFAGGEPSLLERSVVEQIRKAGVIQRTQVRSFDHRGILALRRLEPRLVTSALLAETAPVALAQLVKQAGAEVYCPDFEFLDLAQVELAHAEGIRVVPWTVNALEDCLRLLEWGVDGITTDYPDRILPLLHARGIAF
jgi:glycerophosphoryl diester phosphodiesterase